MHPNPFYTIFQTNSMKSTKIGVSILVFKKVNSNPDYVQQPVLKSTISKRGMAKFQPMMVEKVEGGGREENVADPQSSLVELWTRCSFYNYCTVWPSLTFQLLSAIVFFYCDIQTVLFTDIYREQKSM